MANTAPGSTYSVGDRINTYMLSTEDGLRVSIPMNKWNILFFYQVDVESSIKQALQFSKLNTEFMQANAVVFGVNSEEVERHFRFKRNNKLTTSFLSDYKNELSKSFEVDSGASLDVVVIDPDGKVEQVFRNTIPETCAKDILEYIRKKQS